MTERQAVFAIVSLLMIFGLGEWFMHSYFLLPLPAFEIIMLVLTLAFCKVYNAPFKGRAWLFLGISILFFGARSYNFSFFMNEEALLKLSEGILFDVYYLGAILTLILTIGIEWKRRSLTNLVGLSLVFCVLDLIFPGWGWLSLALINVVISVMLSGQKAESQGNSFWLVLAILEASRTFILLI